MFGLVVQLLVVTFSAVFIAVRIYRALDGWQGFSKPLAGQQNKPSKTSLKAQLGFISLISKPEQKAKTVRLGSPKNEAKAPWGW